MPGFLASKILTALALPLGLGLLLAVTGLLLLVVGRRRTGGLLLTLATAGLWLASTPVVSETLVGALEAAARAGTARAAESSRTPSRCGDKDGASCVIVMGSCVSIRAAGRYTLPMIPSGRA